MKVNFNILLGQLLSKTDNTSSLALLISDGFNHLDYFTVKRRDCGSHSQMCFNLQNVLERCLSKCSWFLFTHVVTLTHNIIISKWFLFIHFNFFVITIQEVRDVEISRPQQIPSSRVKPE